MQAHADTTRDTRHDKAAGPPGQGRTLQAQGMHGHPRLRQLQAQAEMASGAALARLPVQRMGGTAAAAPSTPGGLPAGLQAGLQGLSGYRLDDVTVHYNSPRPAQLHAHAYAQGTAIHLGPGQERHLPHEAWHVVQQKQGRVRPTLQMKGGVPVNDDRALEQEADVMGSRAAQWHAGLAASRRQASASPGVVQGYFKIGGAGRTTAIPEEYHRGPIADRKLNTVLLAWANDGIAHTYDTWQAAINDLVDMHDKIVAISNKLLGSKIEFDNILDNYHSSRSRISPDILDGVQNRLTFLLSMNNDRQYQRQWVVTFGDQYAALVHVLENAARLHELGPVEQAERKEPSLSMGGDEVFEPIEHAELGHLHGIRARLSDANLDERHKAIGVIRGTDNEEFLQQTGKTAETFGPYIKGAILAPFIRDNRRALLDLVHMLGDATAVFSLERGGSLVADHLLAVRHDLLNVKIAKTAKRTTQHKNLAMAMMNLEEGRMFSMLARNPRLLHRPPMITIALTETAISGSSVNTLLKTISDYHHLLPQTQFRLLIERQTIKEKRLSAARTGGIRVEDPGIDMEKNLVTSAIPKVQMFISHAQYILGEDVDYQISYAGAHAGEPLLIFDEANKQIVAVKLSSPSMTPRDILMRMIGGAYDRTLGEQFKDF